MTFREWELKRCKQLLDFLDLEAVVDDAEEEEEFNDEESGRPVANIHAVSNNNKI